MNSAFLCSHDHDVAVPSGMRGEALDRYVLSHSKRVSTFWVAETKARAKRITAWEKSGRLKLTPVGFPWSRIDYFVPDVPRELGELADSAPVSWRDFADAFDGIDQAAGREFAGDIESKAERLMLLAEYLGTRLGADGCGTKDHAAASKAVEKLHLKLRKALGYSYPAQWVLKL